ncbi:hypothetical protein ACI2KR_11490 [Pseudomonas luteola]
MKNNFEKAIINKEILEFFKGEKGYFLPDPDWGDHLHIRNWDSIISYLKDKPDPEALLLNIFSFFIENLKENFTDADSLLMNIRNFYYLKSKGELFPDRNLDLVSDLSDKHRIKIGALVRYLRSIGGYSPPMSSLDDFINEVIKNGGPDLESL